MWSHGSRVRTAVPPRARSPAARRARTSACGSPARSCQPSPATTPSASRTTAPTSGLGLVVPRPRSESSTARRMADPSSCSRRRGDPCCTRASSPRGGGPCCTLRTSRSGALRGSTGGQDQPSRRRTDVRRTGRLRADRAPPRACCLPSGLSPSVPEFHQVNRPKVFSPSGAGRGLSPPARTFTDPGARIVFSAHPTGPGHVTGNASPGVGSP